MRIDYSVKPITFIASILCGYVLLRSVLHWERLNLRYHQDSRKGDFMKTSIQNQDERFQVPVRIQGRVIVERRSFSTPRECRNYTTKLYEQGTFNTTALVSYPGSGNTWLRHLIEMAAGIFTGSVYFDENLYSRGYLGEKESWDSGTTIVQKSHMKYSKQQKFGKAIILIRDPIASTKAFVQYMESGHTGWSSPTKFLHKDWSKYMLHSVFSWLALSKSWLESEVDLLVIHYEDLRTDPVSEISRICDFLQVDCSRTTSTCFTTNIEGVFHRRKTLWKTKMLLSDEDLSMIDKGVLHLNSMLRKYNHKEIPLVKYEASRNQSFLFFHNLTHS